MERSLARSRSGIAGAATRRTPSRAERGVSVRVGTMSNDLDNLVWHALIGPHARFA